MRHTTLTLAAVLLVSGCSGTAAAPSPDAQDTATSASPTVTRAAEPAASSTCPHPHGGVCLGRLAEGRHETSVFEPRLTYSVPDDSWANLEDLPGNFLLERPRDPQGDLTGSYIAVYQNVQAPSLDCLERPELGVGNTPEALVDYYQTIPGLELSKPSKVTLGGLRGYQLDFTVRRDRALCSFDGHAATPLMIGNGVSEVHHVVAPELGVRLVLLRWKGGNVTIEITHDKKQYTAAQWRSVTRPVIRSFEFG